MSPPPQPKLYAYDYLWGSLFYESMKTLEPVNCLYEISFQVWMHFNRASTISVHTKKTNKMDRNVLFWFILTLSRATCTGWLYYQRELSSNMIFHCHRCRQLHHHNISVFQDHTHLDDNSHLFPCHTNPSHNTFFRHRGEFLRSRFPLQGYTLNPYSTFCFHHHWNIYFLYNRCLYQRRSLRYHNKRSLGHFYNEYHHHNRTASFYRKDDTNSISYHHRVVKPPYHSNTHWNDHRYTYYDNSPLFSCHKTLYHNIFALRSHEPVLRNTSGWLCHTVFCYNNPYFHSLFLLDSLCSRCECPSHNFPLHNKHFPHPFFHVRRHCNKSV